MTAPTTLTQLLMAQPQIERIEAFLLDVNGIARGKWLPRDKALELDRSGLPMPRSAYALDIWGCDVEAAGLAFGTGDPDGICRPVPGTAVPMPWTARPTAQVMLEMTGPDGRLFHADSRAILSGMVARLHAKGLQAVVATELEFYLIDPDGRDRTRPPNAGTNRWAQADDQVLSTDALRTHEALFDDIAAACAAQGVPAESVLRENGAGQYEINLRHVADPCLAADHAIFLKRIVKGTAQRHGLLASFMAKPDGARAGSGMHIHCSLASAGGVAVFAAADGKPTAMLHAAVGGLVERLAEVMLVLAPHANSYRRFRLHSHAPTTANWGLDDRSAAIRVIVGSAHATRIEQRVGGADCNPYLALAATLAAILDGIEREAKPPADGGHQPLPREWGSAIAAFAGSTFIDTYFGTAFRDTYVACKRQDFDKMLARVSDVELDTYLGLL